APERAVPETPKRLPPPAVTVKKPAPPPAVPVAEAAAPPAPVETTEEAKLPAAPAFKRRGPHSWYGESQLLQALQRESREVDIETEKGTSAKLLEEAKKAPGPEAARGDKDAPHPLSKIQPVLELLAKRDDLKGLPVRNGTECQTAAKD